MPDIAMLLPCRDCKKLPSLDPVWIGYSLVCDCYDPTPDYSDGPVNTDHFEYGRTKDEVIDLWNDNWADPLATQGDS